MVLEALSKEFRTGCPRELLCADNPVIIAQLFEELCYKLTSWKVNLENKGLRENMKRTKVKFNGQNMNTFLDSGMWPCSVCRSSVGSNSIFCSGCKHWVHKKCTRICSRLVENVIFRTLFQKNTYGGLLLSLTFVTTEFSTSNFIFIISYLCKNRLNMSLSFLLSSLLGET